MALLARLLQHELIEEVVMLHQQRASSLLYFHRMAPLKLRQTWVWLGSFAQPCVD
jgi:hypothetical protein